MHNYNIRFAKKGNIYNNYARTTMFGHKKPSKYGRENMGGKIWRSVPINLRDFTLLDSFMSRMKNFFVRAYGDL